MESVALIGRTAELGAIDATGRRITVCDIDPRAVELARELHGERLAGADVIESGTTLPYPDARFDLVVSTLFFHHLDPAPKRETLREIARVLRRGGEFHVADWGPPSDPVMHAASLSIRLLDGFSNTRENFSGALPELFEEGGLVGAAETRRLRTPFGSLALYRARRPIPGARTAGTCR